MKRRFFCVSLMVKKQNFKTGEQSSWKSPSLKLRLLTDIKISLVYKKLSTTSTHTAIIITANNDLRTNWWLSKEIMIKLCVLTFFLYWRQVNCFRNVKLLNSNKISVYFCPIWKEGNNFIFFRKRISYYKRTTLVKNATCSCVIWQCNVVQRSAMM